jgi:hypothetical protein
LWDVADKMVENKVYKRCDDTCFSYKYGANNDFYCAYRSKLKKINPDQKCVYSLEKSTDSQNLNLNSSEGKLVELAQSPPSGIESKILDFKKVLQTKENAEKKRCYEEIAHLADHLF